MENHFLDVANQIKELALQELDRNRVLEAYELLEMAFTSAFMAKSTTPLSFKLRPRAVLPRPLESIEHVIVQVSRQSIVLFAAADIVTCPLCNFERFPMVGEIFSNIAKKLPETGTFECILDLGDGDDRGAYRRIAYSSARADSILIPDPYFHINDNYDALRKHVADGAKPWRERQDVMFWRGTAGGARLKPPVAQEPHNWDWLQRLQLCAAARRNPHGDKLDIALSSHRQIAEAYWREAIEAAGFLRPEVPKMQFLDYKYLVDIDGWTNSWTLLDKIIGGATIIKVQSLFGYRQWYYDQLRPWENFIPVAADLSDFDQIIDWVIANPDEGARIAENSLSLGSRINLRTALETSAERIISLLQPI